VFCFTLILGSHFLGWRWIGFSRILFGALGLSGEEMDRSAFHLGGASSGPMVVSLSEELLLLE
jgi:hypothetical protein